LPHNIAGLILSQVSKEVAVEIAEDCHRQQPHPGEYRIYLIFAETSHWPTFLPLIVCIYLHSNFCSGLQKTHLFWNSVHISRSRSSKVD